MCGRFTLVKLADVEGYFPWIKPPDEAIPRYNIAPTQPILIAANDAKNSAFQFDYALWGLIPCWAKDPKIGNKMINARAETLAEKPSFRTALKRRRCLIPADGFYEWRKEADGSKTPMYIRMKTGQPFAFAGLWEDWCDHDAAPVRSCTIITTTPNALMKTIHDRMPVILPPEAQHRWLAAGEQNPADLQPLMVPFTADAMEAFPVSRTVNNPRNELPECVNPVVPAEDTRNSA